MEVALNQEVLRGIKTLHKVPAYMGDTKLANNSRILEMGGLANYKRFMVEHKDFTDASYASSMKHNSWSGSNTYDKFLDILEHGDKNVMDKIRVETKAKVAELSKKYDEVIHNYKFDVSGQFFDVGLVLTGVPETWLEPEIEEQEKTQVEIIIQGSFNAGTDEKAIVSGASRILAMTKILEDNDVQVKLKIVSCIKNWANDEGDIIVATDVKDYDEPINYRKVSALLSPTYLRRGMFKAMEYIGQQKLSSGYGQPLEVPSFIELQHTSQIDALEHKLFKREK